MGFRGAWFIKAVDPVAIRVLYEWRGTSVLNFPGCIEFVHLR